MLPTVLTEYLNDGTILYVLRDNKQLRVKVLDHRIYNDMSMICVTDINTNEIFTIYTNQDIISYKPYT